MDDFLSSRPQINTPRNGNAQMSPVPTPKGPLGDLHAEVKTATGETASGAAPKVETVVVNGSIRRIHIHCKCGEEIILHCEYPQ